MLAALAGLAALAFAGEASALDGCPKTTLTERLDGADAAFIGYLDSVRKAPSVGGVERRIFRYTVTQTFKGPIGKSVDVVTVAGPVGLQEAYTGDVGILATLGRNGEWVSSICGQNEPIALANEARPPGRTMVKVGLGVLFTAGVFALAFWRLRRGTRPRLPGAPSGLSGS